MREGCHEPGVGPIVAAQLIVAWSHHGRARLRFTGIVSGRGRLGPERDPLEGSDVIGKVRACRFGFLSCLALDRRRDLLQPLLELARCPRAVVQEVSGCPIRVDEAALIEVTIDRFKDGNAAGRLVGDVSDLVLLLARVRPAARPLPGPGRPVRAGYPERLRSSVNDHPPIRDRNQPLSNWTMPNHTRPRDVASRPQGRPPPFWRCAVRIGGDTLKRP